MRRRIARWSLAGLVGILGFEAEASAQQQYDVAQFLKSYRPINRWVEYDTPATDEEIKACQVEVVHKNAVVDGKPQKQAIGILIRDGQGRVLRRFLDTAEPKGTDQWSYYLDGFEVYRETDYNGDQKVDEIRWLNMGGTRIAVVQGSRITSWRRLSAEEASKVFVQALVSGDLEMINSVMASSAELQNLGLPGGLIEQAKAGEANRKAEIEALTKKLKGWNRQTTWMRFDGVQPHIIPSDAASGIQEDLELYENAVIFAGPPDGQADLSAIAYLQVPEIIRLGDSWKFVNLPRAFDPEQPEVVAAVDGVRSWVYREAGSMVADANNPQLEKALTELAELDQKWIGQIESGDSKALSTYHYQRVQLLRKVVEAASPDERLAYEREIVNSLAAAYQTGEFPAGMEAINKLIEAGGPLGAYAAFRKIPAEYSLRAKDPDKIAEAQKSWVADLKGYLEKYPNSDEVPEALFQLGNIMELNGEDKEAQAAYERIVKDFAQSEPADKASGALRRIQLVGQELALKGKSPAGSDVDIASERGKMVLVVFAASEAEPFRRELSDLIRLHERYKEQGFQVISVSLDPEKTAWTDFVERSQVPWPTIFEDGGMESRLANEFGIISYYYPTMILVDKDGKVLDRDLRTALEVEQAIEKPLAKKP